jgi:amino acid adenylation domain-containing protein
MPADPVSSHGTVHRLPAGADAATCRARLAAATGTPHRVWPEPVPAASGSAVAADRRGREIGRPVGVAGPALRATLLEYADGVRELVLVARPDRIGRAELNRIAVAVTGGEPCPVGPHRCGHPADVTEFAVALPGVRAHPGLADHVAALVSLLLAWAAGHRAVLKVVTPAGTSGEGIAPLEPAMTMGEFRAAHTTSALAQPAPEPADGQELVTVFVDPAPRAPSELAYRPPLSGALTLYVQPDPAGQVQVRGWRRHPARLPGTRQLTSLLASASRATADEDPARLAGDIQLLDAAEAARIVSLGRTARTGQAGQETIPGLVRVQAARSPDATAVSDGHTKLSYRDLVARADAMAAGLREIGVRPRTRVGVCLARSADLVVTLLAVLSAGGTYVPLDPAYPRERLDYLARDADLTLVVADSAAAAGRHTVTPAALEAAGQRPGITPPVLADYPGAGDPAYVIYTSGSTGQPKGVEVPHRNVAALIRATRDDLSLGPADVWTWFHSFAFDVSVWEIWGALAVGSRLVVVPYLTCRSPEDFRRLMVREHVTVLSQTPSAFGRLVDLERAGPLLDDVRLVVLAGEPLDAPRLIPWFDAHPETRCRVVNMFGITETTVHVTAHTVTRADALSASRTVGRPLPGWGIRIVDSALRVLPTGVTGEIAVTGDGLALGYLGRPELTGQRFVRDPADGTRMYLSGDVGLLRGDGTVEHHGRIDSQVKVRGHRIELGEVRHHVLASGCVADVTVLVVPDEQGADGALLTAFVVLSGGDERTLRRHLARSLPEYLVPVVVPVQEIPLTPNGKADARALARRATAPAPDTAPALAADATASSAARRFLLTWQSVLNAEARMEDDFFDSGGNSLLALRLSRALREQGLPVDVPTIYRLRTVRELIEHVSR